MVHVVAECLHHSGFLLEHALTEVLHACGVTDVEQSIIVGIIHEELAPRLLGRTASDPEGAWRAMALPD